MSGRVSEVSVATNGQGMIDVSGLVAAEVANASSDDGLCTVFIRHTSASLVVQENADPSAQDDLERWLERLVPEGDPLYQHTAEGPDDMPAHIKAALTATSLSIPVRAGKLMLGTWQGIFLWEHRRGHNTRRLIIHVL
ncbi:MAG TPA: YjbQ family protein [Myxococcales bacterium]|nr:YjbQ family protein [Myxococcales bacterium]HIL99466.1 YjbQ family protein [Myxococcales bacterium]